MSLLDEVMDTMNEREKGGAGAPAAAAATPTPTPAAGNAAGAETTAPAKGVFGYGAEFQERYGTKKPKST